VNMIELTNVTKTYALDKETAITPVRNVNNGTVKCYV